MFICALIALIVPWNDCYYQNTPIVGNHFPIGAVFILTVFVMLVNPLLRLLRPSAVFKPAELLSIWCITVAGMSIASSSYLRYFYTMLAGLPSFVGTHPTVQGKVLVNLPDWMFPSKDMSAEVVRGFIYGSSEVSSVPWREWLKPTFLWCLFFGCMFWMMFCLTTLFRKQWVENERLSFPLVQLPLELCRSSAKGGVFPALFSRKVFWVGVFIPVVIHGLNGEMARLGLKGFFPVPFLMTLSPYLGLPTGSFGADLNIYFSVIALGFLLTKETTFSLWFFYLFFAVFETKVAAQSGVVLNIWHPFTTNQILGAYIVFAVGLLWQARRHLRTVFKAGLTFSRSEDDANELMSYPAAVWGLVVSVGGIILWSFIAAEGHGLLWAMASCIIWIVVLLVISRVIAQTGLLFVQCTFAAPHMILKNFAMAHMINPRAYAVSVVQGAIIWDIREIMMPNVINNMKIANVQKLSAKKLFRAMVIALVVVFVCASLSYQKLAYLEGSVNWADKWGAQSTPRIVGNHISQSMIQTFPMPGTHLGLLLGAGITAVLTVLRGVSFWWPLSAIGLLFAGTYPMRKMWFSIFLSWLLKWLVMKYGGGKAYRNVRNMCLGMLMGDAIMAGFWTFVGLNLGEKIYSLMPG